MILIETIKYSRLTTLETPQEQEQHNTNLCLLKASVFTLLYLRTEVPNYSTLHQLSLQDILPFLQIFHKIVVLTALLKTKHQHCELSETEVSFRCFPTSFPNKHQQRHLSETILKSKRPGNVYQKEIEKLEKQIRISYISMEYKAREILSASSISIDNTQLYEYIP